jgi:hypothetical protein
MTPKSGNRFSEKIMLHKKLERDGDSKNSHPALAALLRGESQTGAEGPPDEPSFPIEYN